MNILLCIKKIGTWHPALESAAAVTAFHGLREKMVYLWWVWPVWKTILFLLLVKTHVLKNLWHRRGILISRDDCFSWQHFYVFLFIVFQPIRSWWGEGFFFLTWLYKSQCCSLDGWQGCRLICSSKSFVSFARKRSIHPCRLSRRSSPLSPASSCRVST